jgi:transposase InsO family protein
MPLPSTLQRIHYSLGIAVRILIDLCRLALLRFRSPGALAAENLFLRKQLALFQERRVKPHRADNATRWLMAALSRWFPWRDALVIVKPDTLIGWHRKGFGLFWRRKSRPVGRPPLPKDLLLLIRSMASENISWGEERIANELKVKLGIRVAPSTVRKYLGRDRRPAPDPAQRWLTFIRNHADVIVACDFFTVVTARFRILYVFIVMELGRRQILHCGVTDHPTAEWTLQQFREALPGSHPYRFAIHDHDSIYSKKLDQEVAALGVRILRTPVRAPQANSRCERLVGSIRRECLDFLIPLTEGHLRRILVTWVTHYNQGRVHMSLGPGVPALLRPPRPENVERHRIPAGHVVRRKAVLGGLHHEYWLEKTAA